MVVWIPNFLTILRILLCPIIVITIYYQYYQIAFYLFLLAGISDGADGYIAKKFDCTTAFGKTLDPVADKLLIISVFITLFILSLIPFWLLTLVISRDILIVGGYLILSKGGDMRPIEPSLVSKLNTLLQIFLVLLTLGYLAYNINNNLLSWLHNIVAVTTLVSGFKYIWDWTLGKNRHITTLK